ncbi:MAG: hypothetical protein RLZZ330_1164 [Actinomycetota bacterium]|jgi:nitrite reductase/ring-hydroxylating ferredoxin subunit
MLGGTVAVIATMVSPTIANAAKQFKVGNAADFPAGTVILVKIPKRAWWGKKSVSLLSTKTGFFAYEATCTHEQYPLRKAGKKLICDEHDAVFSTKNGAALAGPTRRGLTKYTVTVTDGVVYLTI